jgi:hypothetical protein
MHLVHYLQDATKLCYNLQWRFWHECTLLWSYSCSACQDALDSLHWCATVVMSVTSDKCVYWHPQAPTTTKKTTTTTTTNAINNDKYYNKDNEKRHQPQQQQQQQQRDKRQWQQQQLPELVARCNNEHWASIGPDTSVRYTAVCLLIRSHDGALLYSNHTYTLSWSFCLQHWSTEQH